MMKAQRDWNPRLSDHVSAGFVVFSSEEIDATKHAHKRGSRPQVQTRSVQLAAPTDPMGSLGT